MGMNVTRIVFVLVSIAAVAAAAFRVATFPERSKERRETARSVCTQSGGQWVLVERDEICRRNDGITTGI